VHPLVGLLDSGTLYVVASKAGTPTNPDWYHNLLAHPEVGVEFGDERFYAVATSVTAPKRDRLFAAHVAAQPGFADYEKATERVVPVVELRRAQAPGDRSSPQDLGTGREEPDARGPRCQA
jgi:deazaflavin-dependent oxidoreductase (nitroreductase family)